MKKNQGITLIALIITIIIMLILVAVTIDVVVDGKLFDTAKEAVDKTNDKVGETQDRVDGLMNELDDVYEWQENQGAKEHNWQYTDNTLASLKCTCSICGGERIVHVGQEIPSYEAGPAGTQWVVFGTEDTDNNGTNETLLLTTVEPSSETLRLEGADAYNNGIEKIEAKVKEIYGNEARAMKIEDVNRTLGYTPAGGMYYDINGDLQTTGNFTTKLKDLSIWESLKSNGTETPDGENSEEALGEYEVDGYLYTVVETGEVGLPYAPAGTSNEAKNLVFGTMDTPYYYWLASRGACARDIYAYFGPGTVVGGIAGSYCDFFVLFTSDSDDQSSAYSFSVRPVVSLKSEIPAGGEILVTSEAW